jgi:DNA polymerase I-like protein with 3'-5' exonuclease and polymerase domains
LIIKVDAKALEWRIKAYLSQDKVAIQEILDGVDMHSESQKAFKLPTRLIAKVANFRMIFADAYSDQGFKRPAYAYANDPEFQHVSTSQKFWTGVVEKFFTKYSGMYNHGWDLINQVYKSGRIVNPTGRVYLFEHRINKRGEPELPRTLILNYPVQGLAAELMALARVVLRKRLINQGYDLDRLVLLMNTIHDDIELDVDNNPELIYNICVELLRVFEDLPSLFEKYFQTSFNVPLAGEVSYGHNLANLIEFKKDKEIII